MNQIFYPPYFFQGARPSIYNMTYGTTGGSPPECSPCETSTDQAYVKYDSTFVVRTPFASGISKVRLISPGASTHGFDQNQRMLELNFEVEPEDPGSTYPYPEVLRVSTPTNPSYAPPGWYMLSSMARRA